ncbi:MAG: hypothetical protein AAF847_17190 [Bacteroidota bacterium]
MKTLLMCVFVINVSMIYGQTKIETPKGVVWAHDDAVFCNDTLLAAQGTPVFDLLHHLIHYANKTFLVAETIATQPKDCTLITYEDLMKECHRYKYVLYAEIVTADNGNPRLNYQLISTHLLHQYRSQYDYNVKAYVLTNK